MSNRVIKTLEGFRPSSRTAYIMLAVTMLIWASGMVFARGMRADLPPVALAWWRWALAALILAPFALREIRASWPVIRRNSWIIFLLAAMQMSGSALLFVGVNYTTVITGTLVNGTQPALTALVALIILRYRLTWLQSLGMVVALAGVTVSVSQGRMDLLLGLRFNAGDIIVLVATVAYAIYPNILQKLEKGFSLVTLLFLIGVIGCLQLLPFYIAETVWVRPVVWSPANISVIVYLAVFYSIISIYLWSSSIRTVGPSRAAIFVNLLPIYGVLMAIPFLGEQLFLFHIIGGAGVIGGILLVVRGHR